MYKGWRYGWFKIEHVVAFLIAAGMAGLLAYGLWAQSTPSPSVEPVDDPNRRKAVLVEAFPTLTEDAADYCAAHLTDGDVARLVLVQHMKLKME